MKYYSSLIYGEKFGRYKITFFILLAFFVIGVFLGIIFSDEIFLQNQKYYMLLDAVLYGNTPAELLRDLFLHNFYIELSLMCAVFFAGITVYSPVISGAAVTLRGALCGYTAAIISSLPPDGAVVLLILKVLTGASSGMLFIIFSAVTTRVALRIFTEKPKGDCIFGGTLFNAGEFKRLFNYRFLLSFFLFFVFFLMLSAVVWVIDTLICSLI